MTTGVSVPTAFRDAGKCIISVGRQLDAGSVCRKTGMGQGAGPTFGMKAEAYFYQPSGAILGGNQGNRSRTSLSATTCTRARLHGGVRRERDQILITLRERNQSARPKAIHV